MGYDDFARLPYRVIIEAVRRYRIKETDRHRDGWERMRLHACMVLQPMVRESLDPRKALPLPWDRKLTLREQGLVSREESEYRVRYYQEHGRWPD